MSNRPLPPLSTLQAFCAIAETGGFGRAAERLGLTQTAVSHQIAQLEGWLGERLFERGRRGARLSPAGLKLHPDVSAALQSLETSLHQARAASASPSLAIATTPEFSSQWLAPRLESFCRRYPKIEVQIAVSYKRPDFANADLAIWLGRGGPEVVTEPLLLDDEFVVCAPEVSARLPKRGAIRAAPLLAYRGMRHTVLDWQLWFEQIGGDPDAPELAGYDITEAVRDAKVFNTVEEMLADPIVKNGHFGRYTNFVNLYDYAAIAIPAGFGRNGLPGGVTLIGPAFTDDALAPFADAMHRALGAGMGKDKTASLPEESRVAQLDDGFVPIVVVGAHLTGMPLNHELTGPGGYRLQTCRTAGDYRLFVLPNTVPSASAGALPSNAVSPLWSSAVEILPSRNWSLRNRVVASTFMSVAETLAGSMPSLAATCARSTVRPTEVGL